MATIFEPASEHGQRGMDELHQQTVNLLSFQPLPKDVFDAQVAFNMVARYGQKSQTGARFGGSDECCVTIARLPATMLRNLRFCCCRLPFFTAMLWPCSWKWNGAVDVAELIAVLWPATTLPFPAATKMRPAT